MGIPYWKPKEEKKTIKINRHDRVNDSTRQRIRRPIRLRNRNTSESFPTASLLSQPYVYPPLITSITPSFIPTDDPSTTRATISSSSISTSAPTNLTSLRRRHLPNVNNSSIHNRRAEIDSRIHQRYLDKEELLNQLEITTSLLDQFISIRQISGEDLALPNFIAEDLTTILSATSINMEDTNTTTTTASASASLTNINNSINNNNNNNQINHTLLPSSRSSSSLSSLSSSPFITLNRSSIIENNINQPQHPLTIISPNRNNNSSSPSIDELVDMVMSNPPHSSRLAELDESIANAHHRVTDQLELLGW